MTDFHNGDEVRVTYKGTVRGEPGKTWRHLFVQTDDGESYSPSIKHVTLIDPAYESGQLYRDAAGDTFRYNGGDWTIIYRTQATIRRGAIGHFCGNDVPKRPLRKLVPESR